jgi:hypothetical protein
VNAVQYAVARQSLIARTLLILSRLFLNMGSWRDGDVARFQRDALPVLQGAQRALGRMVAVRVAQSATTAAGGRVAPPAIPDDLLVGLRQGVTVQDEYRRPFEQAWYGLSLGEPVEKAVDRGRIRLVQLADIDLQMAEASASREAMTQAGALWWKRVPQGEETCLLCLVASTRAYYVADLKPIHPGCDCAVAEQFSPRPDGGVHDEALLRKAYDAAADATGRRTTAGSEMRDLLADVTSEHSEVGPMLVYPRGVKRTAAA